MTDVCVIPLSCLGGGYEAIVDPEDLGWLTRHKWRALASGQTHIYACRTDSDEEKQFSVRMHREILRTPQGLFTDHINGNTLDNRKANLRVCTMSQNGVNKDRPKSATNPYRGVYKSKTAWQVRIGVNGENVYGGRFWEAEEAAREYDRLAIILHGEFARLNFPTDLPPAAVGAVT